MRRSNYRFDTKRFSSPPSSRRPNRAGKVAAVTGGAGFIGSHLCEALVESGCEVVCIDSFQTGSPHNVARLEQTGRLTIVRHDIMRPLPKNLPQFDEIFNFACPSSRINFQADRVSTALTCALGALNVLERAERDGARVLQASSAHVYGNPDAHPQPESCRGQVDPVGPRACYDEGKRFAEALFTDFGEKAGLAVRIARIFNTYGPRMQIDDGRVVSNFIVQALSGRDLTVYGDGRQTRSFCYVDDVVAGCLKLMASSDEVVGPVNLGDPLEITIADLADTVLALTGSRSRVVYRSPPPDDPQRRKPDITLAETLLGWRPEVSLRDGLERTIESFAQRLDATPEPALALPARA